MAKRKLLLSEETCQKMSAARKGEKNPNWGKHPSPETRQKMSAAHKGKKYPNRLNRWRFLTPEEVPPRLRQCFDFDLQRVGHREKLEILVKCPSCGKPRYRLVVQMRREIREEGVTFHCQSCAAKSRPHPHILGPSDKRWMGGRRPDGGYMRLHRNLFSPPEQSILEPMFRRGVNRNYILEHRAVVALALGRPLKSNEWVHHINGNPSDNRLENLRLVNHHKEQVCPRCGWPMDNLLL